MKKAIRAVNTFLQDNDGGPETVLVWVLATVITGALGIWSYNNIFQPNLQAGSTNVSKMMNFNP